MKKSKPFSVFCGVSFLLMLPIFSPAQIFYAHQGAKLVALSEENAAVQLGSVESFLSLQKAYQNLKNNAKIVVPDSVVIYFTTDDAGKISSVKTLHAVSAVHVEAMEKAISKQTLTAASSHLMIWVFPKLDVEAYPIWDIESPPNLKSCRAITKEPNSIFSISCFNYVAKSRLLAISDPSPKKEEELQGYFRAMVTISAKGDVQMVAFHESSKNPNVNDYFVSQLHLLDFPEGGTMKGKTVGYTLEFEDEYFAKTPEFKFQIEDPVSYEYAYYLYNNFKNNQKLAEDSTKQALLKPEFQAQVTKFSKINELTLNRKKPIPGPFLFFRISPNNWGPINGTEVYLPLYSAKKKTDSRFAMLPICDTAGDFKNQTRCTAKWLLNYFYDSVHVPKYIDLAISISLSSILINEAGEIERIVVIGGDIYPQIDLEIMRLLSELPKFTPGTIDGAAHPTLYNVLVMAP